MSGGGFDNWFGGGKPKKMTTMTQEQEALAYALASLIGTGGQNSAGGKGVFGTTDENRLTGPLGTATPYTDTPVPGLSDLWQKRIDQFSNVYARDSKPSQNEKDSVNRLLSGQSAYDLNPQVMTDYFNNAVETPAMRSFSRNIAPQIMEGFASPGGVFNSRAGTAQANALSDMNTGLNAQRSTMAWNAQSLAAQLADAAAGRQVQGLSAANTLRQAPLQTAMGLEQLQLPLAQMRSQESQRLAPENNPWMARIMALLGIPQTTAYNPGGYINRTTKGVSDVAGMIGSVYSLGATSGMGSQNTPSFGSGMTPLSQGGGA